MRERIVVETEGIDDQSIVDAIRETVRASFRERVLPGAWRVVIRPSHVGGRWDVQVYGVDTRHTLSIAVPAPLLADLIPVRLREALARLGAARVPAA
jgi:hypothetical protein